MDESQQINKQKKINNLHESALRLIYCDNSSTFQELLQRNNSMTIHQKNIQVLAIMMYNRPGREWRTIARAHAHTRYILFSCAMIAHLGLLNYI